MLKHLIPHLMLSALVLGLIAAPMGVAASAPFFAGDAPEGWFWYDVQPPPKPEEKPEPKPKPAVAEAPPPAPAEARPKQESAPEFGSVAWIRANLDKYRDRAIDDPSRKNVLAYMFLQRLAMDKSQRFADAVNATVKTTPALDENTRRPISAIGTRLADEKANAAKAQVMKDLVRQVGLWFFYAGDCNACASQASILAGVEEIYGLKVTAISLDGTAPPPPFASARADEGQAERLGIETPLALYLANPQTRQVVAIAQGLLARDQIVSRILLAAHTAGWLSDEQYQQTRPMRTNDLLTEHLALNQDAGRGSGAAVGLSPDEILQRLRVGAAERLLK